jgi:imidazolonepropionase-like amidohydrolase
MNVLVLSALTIRVAATLQLSQPATPPAGTFVISDVTVIDATGGPALKNMVVMVEGGRIRTVQPLRGFRPPPGIRVISGGGRYLIPGLWDMHVHMTTRALNPAPGRTNPFQDNSRYYLPLFVSWGVTGVRDMSGRLDMLTAWRDSVNRNWLIGPRMVVTGFKLGSQAVLPGQPFPLRSETDVRQSIRALHRQGADFVKIDELPAEYFPALIDECRRLGLTFVGHVTSGMTVGQASRLGQRGIEHLDGILLSVSSSEASIRAWMRRQNSWGMRLAFSLLLVGNANRLEVEHQILTSQDPARADSLYALLASRNTWQTPTLSGLRDVQSVREIEPFAQEREAYLPPRRNVTPSWWEIDPALAGRLFNRQLQVAGEMYRAGVPLLAGTDTPGLDRIPGFSLVEELELLVRAGLSPLAALQAATREPARFLGLADSLGTIEVGKIADLVLLDADPLADIRNVHKVHAVVLRGRYLSAEMLQSMRAEVRQLIASLKR